MPPTSSYSIWSTTIIVVDGNFNIVRGNLSNLDRRTTITNTDSFNVENESTVTGQPLLPTTSLAPTFPVPPNPSFERPDHDTDRPTSISEAPYQPVDVAVSVQSTMEPSSLDDEHSFPLHQLPTEASEPQLALSPPRQYKSDERGSPCIETTIEKHSLIKTNRFKSVHTKIKDRIKRAFRFFLRATRIDQ